MLFFSELLPHSVVLTKNYDFIINDVMFHRILNLSANIIIRTIIIIVILFSLINYNVIAYSTLVQCTILSNSTAIPLYFDTPFTVL